MTPPRRNTILIAGTVMAGFTAGFSAHHLNHSPERNSNRSESIVDKETASHSGLLSILGGISGRTQSGGQITGAERAEIDNGLRKWINLDSVACLNHLSENGMIGLFNEDEIAGMLRSAAGATSSSLARVASNLRDPRLADRIYQEAFRMALRDSPESSFNLIAALPRHLQRTFELEAVQAVVKQSGPDGFERVFSQFKISAPALKKGLLSVGAMNPKEAFELIERNRERVNDLSDMPGGDNQALITLIAVGKPDPDLSLSWLNKMAPSNFVDTLLVEVLSQKLQKQPDSADDIFRAAGHAQLASDALTMAASGLAKTRPDLAQKLIEKIPSDRSRADAYSNAGRWMILSNPTGALNLAASATNPIDRARSVGALAQTWLEEDFGKALDYTASRASDPAFKKVLVSNLSQRINPANVTATATQLSALKALPPETKAALREHVAGSLTESKRDVLLSLLQ
jgi:hypothetical protein